VESTMDNFTGTPYPSPLGRGVGPKEEKGF
jgi:hypothetical protein